jgi:26S proteasome non-ATPase regulatory subunit 9
MAVIEKHIHEHFASLAEDGARDETANIEVPSRNITSPISPPQVLEAPFAKVNSVATGGPAEAAGLKPGDQIRNFGYVNHSNHDGLRRVGECVQANEGVSVHAGVFETTTNYPAA